ncbi:hypothetical protein PHYPSEUDO_004817 [Phytophthora pseudosyringae]|uniref:Uncharacterized protein n=1 Tax=Phytophthora pseudosyringae TaxID=221518 RepID=A0A8T1VMG3_9STRA|nr:hypothetical protein PHYPSEUDO_004817 [Phytophthora pseudosyringae]
MAATTSTAARAVQPFRELHALHYGLEVVARDAESGAATCLVCLFCRHLGREERPGRKRKSASTIKYFRAPYRTDQYLQHLTTQHPTQWSKYRQMTDKWKRAFFPTDLTRPEPGKERIESEKDVVEAAAAAKELPAEKHCWFLIPKRIVDLAVPLAALAGTRGWQPSNFRACELVELSRAQAGGACTGAANSSGEERDKYYQVAVFTRMELDVVVDSLAAGMSSRQVAMHLAALARRTTGAGGAAPVFPLLTADEVREHARLTVSTSMQLTGQLLSRSWGFGLVLREVTAAPIAPRAGYLDVRVVVYALGRLRDIHVVALPLFQRHTAVALAQAIQNVLDAVFPLWRSRVLGITQDGHADDETNPSVPADQCTSPLLPTSPSIHRTAEVLMLLETSIQTSTPTIPNRVVLKTWGGCRQVSLALSSFYESLLSGGFLPALRTLTAYVRQHPGLLQEMGPPPSSLVNDNGDAETLSASVDLKLDTEWLAMGLHTQWITDKRVRLRKYLEQQSNPPPLPTSSTPSSSIGEAAPVDNVWWVAFFVVHWVATRANEVFEKLRLPRVSLPRQAQIITEMSTELIATFIIQRGQRAEGQELPYHSRQGKFSILKSNVHEFLEDQGIFVSNVAARLDPAALDAVLETIALSLVNLAESLTDLSDILPESRAVDESAAQLPPVLPHELTQLSGREFTALLRRCGGQLRVFYSDEELDTMEQEHQALCRASMHDTEFKAALAQCHAESPFEKSWELTESKFPLLQVFAGVLASAHVGRDAGCKKALVDLPSMGASSRRDTGDDGLRLAAMDFGLETTLHAGQFDALLKLSQTEEPPEANAA